MLKLYVLRKVTGHDRKQIDNRKVTWEYWKRKLIEEVVELLEAIDSKDKSKIMEETMDVFQICIEMAAKLFKEGMVIEQGIHRHNKKLASRGCEVAAVIRFSISKK